ncbi:MULTISPECIES: hypothetical protein [unclassified Pseudomonas]|uniref:hypothetical protein n=1 Tax=unclassified Pseudomonas TaxID=196821 RepID=UPI00320B518B
MKNHYELIITRLGGPDSNGAIVGGSAEIAFFCDGEEVSTQKFEGSIFSENGACGFKSITSGPSGMTAALKSGECTFTFRPFP